VIYQLNPQTGARRAVTVSHLIEAVELATTEPGWVVDRLLHGATIAIGCRYWLSNPSAYELNELRAYIEEQQPEPELLAGHPGMEATRV
jgi:hypothetical protein